MSRIGKQPIVVPAGVQVHIAEQQVQVTGPKGAQTVTVPRTIQVRLEHQQVLVRPTATTRQARALHGLTRTLVANAVHGVVEEFRKELDIVGLGYRAQVEGKTLTLQLGFSHPIRVPIPEGMTVKTPKPTQLVILGIDKQRVGQLAADLRALAPPEPYKGTGIRYVGESIRRKAGKAAAGSTTTQGA